MVLQPRAVAALAIAITLGAVAMTCFGASGLELVARLVVIAASAVLVITAPRGRETTPGAERIEREEKGLAAELARTTPERRDDTAETAMGKRHRETYIAAVSHELRTPLNAILGFTQVLLSEIDGPLSPSQREDVTAIHDAGMHLRALVEEVIGESAGSSSAREIRAVAIEPLVRELGRGLEAQLRGRPVTLRLAIDPDLPSPVGDARRLRQILWNLGSNAVRYTERGEIEIRVKLEGDNLRFSVRDTGRGIAEKDLARIFAPGERVERTEARPNRARPSEGWGLGLAIAQEMAEFHGGNLSVESELGRGSTFHLVMPATGLRP